MTETMTTDTLTLTSKDTKTLERHAVAIDRAKGRHVESILEMGKHLAEAQELLANHHGGTFNAWIEERCGLERRTAYRYIAAFRVFSGCDNLSQLFDASAMYLLAAESTPEEALQDALERAESGERITYSTAKEIVASHKEDTTLEFWDMQDGTLNLRSSIIRLMNRWSPQYRDVFSKQLRMLAEQIDEGTLTVED